MNYSTSSYTQQLSRSLFQTLVQSYRALLAGTVVLAALSSAVYVATHDSEYRADVELLVVQYSDGAGLDGELVSRSAETINQNLVKVVGTTSFLDKVTAATDAATIVVGQTELERKQSWNNHVTAVALPNSAIMRISAYHTSQDGAVALAQAVAKTITEDGSEYHGASDYLVAIKQIDSALVSTRPVRPSIPSVIIVSVLLSFVAILLYIWMTRQAKLASRLATLIRQYQVPAATGLAAAPAPLPVRVQPQPAVPDYAVLEHHNWADRIKRHHNGLVSAAAVTMPSVTPPAAA